MIPRGRSSPTSQFLAAGKRKPRRSGFAVFSKRLVNHRAPRRPRSHPGKCGRKYSRHCRRSPRLRLRCRHLCPFPRRKNPRAPRPRHGSSSPRSFRNWASKCAISQCKRRAKRPPSVVKPRRSHQALDSNWRRRRICAAPLSCAKFSGHRAVCSLSTWSAASSLSRVTD